MFARSGLGDAEFPGNQQAVNPVLNQIAVHLRAKMPARIAQPVEDHQPAAIGERSQSDIKIHIDD